MNSKLTSPGSSEAMEGQESSKEAAVHEGSHSDTIFVEGALQPKIVHQPQGMLLNRSLAPFFTLVLSLSRRHRPTSVRKMCCDSAAWFVYVYGDELERAGSGEGSALEIKSPCRQNREAWQEEALPQILIKTASTRPNMRSAYHITFAHHWCSCL